MPTTGIEPVLKRQRPLVSRPTLIHYAQSLDCKVLHALSVAMCLHSHTYIARWRRDVVSEPCTISRHLSGYACDYSYLHLIDVTGIKDPMGEESAYFVP